MPKTHPRRATGEEMMNNTMESGPWRGSAAAAIAAVEGKWRWMRRDEGPTRGREMSDAAVEDERSEADEGGG